MKKPEIALIFRLFLFSAYANNTSINYLMNLSKILNIAVDRGYLEQNPYPQLRYRKDEVDKDFLTEEELDKVMKKIFASERLSELRDAFVLSCLTGLAFIDFKTLTREHLVTNHGEDWILKLRSKSKVVSLIPLFPGAKKILNKYKPYADKTSFLLPVRTNQKDPSKWGDQGNGTIICDCNRSNYKSQDIVCRRKHVHSDTIYKIHLQMV